MSIVNTSRALGFSNYDHKFARSFCERTRSESTRRNYKQVLDEFFVFMGGVNPTVVTPDDIRTWRDCLITAGKSSSTVILKLAVVRSFYQYLISADIINLNQTLTRS